MKRIVNLLHKDLSYKIQGIAFEIRKNFGLGHKEQIYQKAFEEELKSEDIFYEREKAIKIFSPKDGKFIGLYRPDFIIDNKIILEIKTYKSVPKDEMRKIYDYLRNSKYELGYLINFTSPRLYIKRIILTNDKKEWLKKLLVSVSLWLVLFSGLPLMANAAILYLEPSQGEYHEGETIITEIRVDTEGENINSVEAKLSFPAEFLEVKDFSTGNSILTFWVNGPQIDQESGTISFSGAIPGGYSGRLPGDPGESNLLGRIIFKMREAGIEFIDDTEAKIEFQDSEVLLNDGFGTPANLSTQSAVFKILARVEIAEASLDKWQEEIEKDKILPEPFKIEYDKDPLIFDGKYFIIFSTTDKQTGIDYYEVSETKDAGQEAWERVESPHLLADQSLTSIIKVKAVDKAGNERIESLEIPKKLNFENFYWLALIPILIGIGIFWSLFRRLIKSTENKK